MDILCLGKASLYNKAVLALNLQSIKNELFSDCCRTLKDKTVRIAIVENFNQNLQCN